MNLLPSLHRFHRFFATTCLIILGLSLNACLENSTVVRVRKDGSGEIFARYYFSPQMTGMMSMMSGLAATGLDEGDSPAGTGATPATPSPETLLSPSREDLEKDAAGYGKGVRYERHETGKNGNGWDGYLVVYQFDDISQLRLDPSRPPGPLDDIARSNPAAAQALEDNAEAVEEMESPLKFAMNEGVLAIETGFSPESLSDLGGGGLGGGGSLPGGGAISGPDGQAIDPAAAMQMAAGMFEGMRIALFIRIDGEIAETNAKFVDETLITLSDLQPAKMAADPKFMEVINGAQGLASSGQEPTTDQAATLVEQVMSIEGMKIETQDSIQIRFK